MRMTRYLLIGLVIVISCTIKNNSPEYKRNEEIVRYWYNREIIIPDSLILLKNKQICQSYKLRDTSENKIIALVSGDCQMCVQEIRNWIPFFKKMKENKISNRLFFVIENIDIEYFKKMYSEDLPSDFEFYIDKKGKFSSINHFPQENMYKTVLLDRSNKIKLIGSPVSNKQFWNLYFDNLKK
ncbi:MAG: hypothetical protein AAGU19_10410 [Prolixibacteraceae bacterium]